MVGFHLLLVRKLLKILPHVKSSTPSLLNQKKVISLTKTGLVIAGVSWKGARGTAFPSDGDDHFSNRDES